MATGPAPSPLAPEGCVPKGLWDQGRIYCSTHEKPRKAQEEGVMFVGTSSDDSPFHAHQMQGQLQGNTTPWEPSPLGLLTSH